MRYDDCVYYSYYFKGKFVGGLRVQIAGFRMNEWQSGSDLYQSKVKINSEQTIKRAQKQGFKVIRIDVKECPVCGLGEGGCFCKQMEKLFNSIKFKLQNGLTITLLAGKALEEYLNEWRDLGLKPGAESIYFEKRRELLERYPNQIVFKSDSYKR